MTIETTRRAIVAGIAATPLAALSSLAGAAPLSAALVQAIARHKASRDAFLTCGDSDAEINATGAIEREARWELSILPCHSVNDLLGKLRYLIDDERRDWGEPEFHESFGCVVVAVDAFLNPADYASEEEQT